MQLPEWITKKEGPLPVWGWVSLGAGVYGIWIWYRNRQAGSSTQSSSIVSPQPIYGQGGTSATGSTGTASGGGSVSAAPLACPTNFAPDPTGTFCLPTAAYLSSLLPSPPPSPPPPSPPPAATFGNGGGVSQQPVTLLGGGSLPSSITQSVGAGGQTVLTGPGGVSSFVGGAMQISQQELAYLLGGAAGEQQFIQTGQVPSGPVGGGTTITPSFGNGGTPSFQPAPANCPPGTLALPGLGGPGQCVPVGTSIGAAVGGGSSSQTCPPGSRWLPGVGGPGACVPYNLPIGAPV